MLILCERKYSEEECTFKASKQYFQFQYKTNNAIAKAL